MPLKQILIYIIYRSNNKLHEHFPLLILTVQKLLCRHCITESLSTAVSRCLSTRNYWARRWPWMTLSRLMLNTTTHWSGLGTDASCVCTAVSKLYLTVKICTLSQVCIYWYWYCCY